MGTIASQITSFTIVYSTFYSDADQRKHQSSASLAFVWGSHRRRVNSPHKWPATRKMFPFDDVIMHTLKTQTFCSMSSVMLNNVVLPAKWIKSVDIQRNFRRIRCRGSIRTDIFTSASVGTWVTLQDSFPHFYGPSLEVLKDGNRVLPMSIFVEPIILQILGRHCLDHLSVLSLLWYQNECDDVSNYRRFDCLLNCLFRRESKRTSKLLAAGLWEGNPPVTGELSSQRAGNAENVSIWWRHHASDPCPPIFAYSVTAFWCVLYDYRHTLTWMETEQFCAAKGGHLIALESQRKMNNIPQWHETCRFTQYS